MNSVKLNKKHLFSILLSLVLLFSLNLNTFAAENLFSFYDAPFEAFANINGTTTNVTSKVTKTRSDKTANNGRNYTYYTFALSIGTASYMSLNTGVDLHLFTDTEFEYDFQFKILSNSHTSTVNITLWVTDASGQGTVIQLYKGNGLDGGDWVNVSGTFKTPNISGACTYSMFVQIGDEDGSTVNLYSNQFSISDIRVEPVGPLYGKPITPADTSGLTGIIDQYDDLVGRLPSIKDYDTDKLFDVNIDVYTNALDFVKEMFDNFIALSGLNAVLIFALCIGLATYIIGRKVG